MDLMTLRRRLLLSGVPLPSGYTRLHYIKGTGAYIDTDLILQHGCVITIVFETVTSNSEQAVWGFRYAGNWSAITQAHIYYSNGNRLIALGKGLSLSQHGNNSAFEFNTVNRIVIDTDHDTVRLNGQDPEVNFDFSDGAMFDSTGSSVYPPFLLASNRTGTFGVASTDTKLYEYKVVQNGRTQAYMIPCINPNNVYGMYDVIRKRFFGSARNNYRFTGG